MRSGALFRLFIINLFLGFTVILNAGTTGKIAGKITDAQTGEPLIGVNVVIEGRAIGAATDVEGEFYILNVPPGTYKVRISMLGYQTKIVTDVRVQVDLTTQIEVDIAPEALELGGEITVTANIVIQKDLTSSERTMQSEQIAELPARDVTSILTQQAGITKDASGNLHIRGGRTSEISYMVDGVQVMNPINRSSGISIDDQAIAELKAITGTFNAEYGQALSGVVNIVTKKGSDKFTVNATGYFGDYLSFDDDVYYYMGNADWARAAANALVTRSGRLDYDFTQYGINGTSELQRVLNSNTKPWQTKESYLDEFRPYKHYDLQVNMSGPVPFTKNRVSFFVAGRYNDSPGYFMAKRYFKPWGLWQPATVQDYEYEMPDNELVPLNEYTGYSTQSKLFFNFIDFNFSYGIYYNNDHSYNGYGKYLPDGGINYYTERIIQILTASYIFSNSTFMNLIGSYYINDNKGCLYEDPYDKRYVPTQAGDFQQFMFDPERGDDVQVGGNPFDFAYWGNNVNRSKNIARYLSVKADLTSQINKYNLVKLGVSGRFHDLEQDFYQLQFSQTNYRPVVPDKSSAFHSFYTAKPYEFAAYIQDKIEFNELIINLGLRFDYFYSDGKVLADPRDPQIYSPFKIDHIYNNYEEGLPEDQLVEYTVDERREFWYKDPDAKYQLSPRFGLAFPITAEGVIHFSYGHFFQNPEFQYLYANPNFWVAGAGAQNLVGNANLNPERTIMYEVGLQQNLPGDIYLHITGFYRDIRDWVSTGIPVDTYSGQTYYSYVNKANAVAKGVTISASMSPVENLFLSMDYTFMEAKGTSSNVSDAYNDLAAGKAPRIELINLDWDQPHSLNMNVNYKYNNWSVTLIGALNSGFPYTPEFARGETTGGGSFIGLRENSERRPYTVNLDLRISRTFKVGQLKLQAIADVTNLLDTRNASYVYADTGLPDYTLQDYLSVGRLTEISSSNEFFTNPGMYTNPRYISFGLRVSY